MINQGSEVGGLYALFSATPVGSKRFWFYFHGFWRLLFTLLMLLLGYAALFDELPQREWKLGIFTLLLALIFVPLGIMNTVNSILNYRKTFKK